MAQARKTDPTPTWRVMVTFRTTRGLTDDAAMTLWEYGARFKRVASRTYLWITQADADEAALAISKTTGALHQVVAEDGAGEPVVTRAVAARVETKEVTT